MAGRIRDLTIATTIDDCNGLISIGDHARVGWSALWTVDDPTPDEVPLAGEGPAGANPVWHRSYVRQLTGAAVPAEGPDVNVLERGCDVGARGLVDGTAAIWSAEHPAASG